MNNTITLGESFPSIATSIKRLAKGVIDSQQPTDVMFGVVERVQPLVIRIGQDMPLTDEYLILTNAVKDHSVDITVSWSTEEENEHVHGNGNNGSPTDKSIKPHKHEVKGRKKITIHNGLTLGEKVLLLRTQGGQNYVVIDRVDEIPTTGECL